MKCKRIIAALLVLLLAAVSGCSSAQGQAGFLSGPEASGRMDIQAEGNRAAEDGAYASFSDKTEGLYYDTFDRIMGAQVDAMDDGTPLDEKVFRGGFKIYSTVRSMSPFIFLGSMLLGILITIACRKNKAARRVGIYGFVIAIPLFLVVFVYGIGIVMDMFLF